MAFFDKLKATAGAFGDKANEMIEITKLNSKISAENNTINDAKNKIGGIVYEHFASGESFPPEISELCRVIQNSLANIEALQNEIAAIKSEGAKASPASGFRASAAGVTCPACGAANSSGVRFCRECGSKLEAEAAQQKRFCPSCGAEVEDGVRFCGSCGFKME